MTFAYWLDKYGYYLYLNKATMDFYILSFNSKYPFYVKEVTYHPDWNYIDYLDEITLKARFDANYCWRLREIFSQEMVADLIECCKANDEMDLV